MNIFHFDSYKEYLAQNVKELASQRGYQSRLAQAAKVHPSYISRVISDNGHLTPDQAILLCRFWGFRTDETDYFINLVLRERAADPELKNYLSAKITELRARNDELSQHLIAEKVNPHQNNQYYSHWIFAAVHILLGVRNINSAAALSERLRIALPIVEQTLQTLEQMGLVKQDGNNWRITKQNIHLSNNSWMAGVSHASWRAKCMERIGHGYKSDLHYTGVHSLATKDVKKIRQILQESLISIDEVVRPSRNETAMAICLDMFEL